MVVERSLNTLNATIADTRSRVAALEKRKAGGAGVKIYVGPDYRGDGPKLLTPAIPNPQVLINHAVRPDPITGVTVYRKTGDGLEKYDFNSERWDAHTQPGFNTAPFSGYNSALNGWVQWRHDGENVVNLRTGKRWKVTFPAWAINSIQGGRYLVVSGGYGNPYVFDVLEPVKDGEKYKHSYTGEELTRVAGIDTIYVSKFVREQNKELFWLGTVAGGQTVVVSKWEWTQEYEKKYERRYFSLTAQGNVLMRVRSPLPGTNQFDLLSGHDGRFLGNPWGYRMSPLNNGYVNIDGNIVADSQFQNPVALYNGSIVNRSMWKNGFLVNESPRLSFYNLDGSFNRAVIVGNDFIVDYDV